MKKYIKVLNFFLFLSIGAVLMYLSFKGINFGGLFDELKNANYFWVILAIVLGVFSHLARAYRWNMLIEPLGYKPHLKNTFYAVMIGYMTNFALPRMGEITRCGMLGKKEKIPVDALIGTVILERGFDMIILLLLMTLVIFAKIDVFGAFIGQNVFDPLLDKVQIIFTLPSYILVILAIIPVAMLVLYFKIRHWLWSIAFLQRMKEIVKNVIRGIKTVFKMKKGLEFLLFTAIIWILYFLMTYLIFFALPALSHLKIIDGLFILVVSSLGISAPVQGGFGAFHWLVSSALTFYGVTREYGLVYATISHESQTLMIVIVGLISFILLFAGKKTGVNEQAG